MKNKWILFVASRYIFKGRGNSPVLSILGIAVGVLALIVILAVMNGFQLGFIESIIEISSYHLRMENVPHDKKDAMLDLIRPVPVVKSAVPFMEFQALARGRRSSQQVVLARGVPTDAPVQDEGMKNKLEFEAGSFDITETGSILLGTELARRLGLGLGDDVTMYSITEIMSAEEENGGQDTFKITGIFRTGYYEYDCSWAFINIENKKIFSDKSNLLIGIKILDRFNDKHSMEYIKKNLETASFSSPVNFTSWRDYNRSFFGALRTEKLFMFILVGLIFIVVGLNIFQAQRRAVLQRREEIGLLRAVGGTQRAVRFVFVCDGAIIGFTGAGIGLALGLVIASNIPSFFSLIEKIVNFCISIINLLASFLGFGWAGNFSVFSPAIFYIKEIPSRIISHEVVFIFIFGFISALSAAWFASLKASKIHPAEVLRYE